ncbi:DUF6126 family protein [Streptomyces olivaceus]|nr:DUF6126 family protein [Streptomyces olivaceus]GHI98743.1 hypothetical protein TPA0906_06090 [Streptomyces olivaceus]
MSARTTAPVEAGIQEDAPMSHETSAAQPGRPAEKKDRKARKDEEGWFERGVALRAGFYIFGTHLFAGFIWLLFYLGEHAHK